MTTCAFAALALLAGVLSSCVPSSEKTAERTKRAQADERMQASGGTNQAVGDVKLAPNERFAGDVVLTIDAPVTEEGPHHIRAITNLPDGTSLLFTVTSSSSPDNTYQDHAVVKEGKALAGPFGKKGELPPGKYSVDVTMSIPSTQSEGIRKVIGENGEHLRGPLVKRNPIGVTVEQVQSFTLGKVPTANVSDTNAKARVLLAEAEKLEKATKPMSSLRRTRDQTKLRQCGEMMRKLQPQAERLRDKARALPVIPGMHIAIAAGHLVLCSSCLDDAESECVLARKSLMDARTAVSHQG